MFNFGPSPNILQRYLGQSSNQMGQVPQMNQTPGVVTSDMMRPMPSMDASTMGSMPMGGMNNGGINAGPSPAMMSSMGMAPGQNMSSQPDYNPMSGIPPTGPPRQGNGGPLRSRTMQSFSQMRNMNPQTAHNMNNLTRVQKG